MNNLKKMISFLCGESDFNGLWFGEKALSHKGKFWWRKDLRNALAEVEAELTELRKERDDLLNALSTIEIVTDNFGDPLLEETVSDILKDFPTTIDKRRPPANKDKDNG